MSVTGPSQVGTDAANGIHDTMNARGQDRGRLAGAAMARAHSPRHIGERLGHNDHDLAARGQSGRRDESKQRRTGMDPSLGHGQHPRQRGHPWPP